VTEESWAKLLLLQHLWLLLFCQMLCRSKEHEWDLALHEHTSTFAFKIAWEAINLLIGFM
jgi:hypothetical protein